MSETNNESVTEARKSSVTKKAAVVKKTAEVKAETAVKSAAEKKPASSRKPRVKKEIIAAPDAEMRYRMVEEAAYYIAEQHGFTGNSAEYWIEAEVQISQLLGDK